MLNSFCSWTITTTVVLQSLSVNTMSVRLFFIYCLRSDLWIKIFFCVLNPLGNSYVTVTESPNHRYLPTNYFSYKSSSIYIYKKPFLASFYVSNLCHKCILHFFSAALPFFHFGSSAFTKAQRLSIKCNLNGHSLPTERAVWESAWLSQQYEAFPSHFRMRWVLPRHMLDAFHSKTWRVLICYKHISIIFTHNIITHTLDWCIFIYYYDSKPLFCYWEMTIVYIFLSLTMMYSPCNQKKTQASK